MRGPISFKPTSQKERQFPALTTITSGVQSTSSPSAPSPPGSPPGTSAPAPAEAKPDHVILEVKPEDEALPPAHDEIEDEVSSPRPAMKRQSSAKKVPSVARSASWKTVGAAELNIPRALRSSNPPIEGDPRTARTELDVGRIGVAIEVFQRAFNQSSKLPVSVHLCGCRYLEATQTTADTQKLYWLTVVNLRLMLQQEVNRMQKEIRERGDKADFAPYFVPGELLSRHSPLELAARAALASGPLDLSSKSLLLYLRAVSSASSVCKLQHLIEPIIRAVADRLRKVFSVWREEKRKLEKHRKATPEAEWGIEGSADKQLFEVYRAAAKAVTDASDFAIKVLGTIRDGQCALLSQMHHKQKHKERVKFLHQHVVQLLQGNVQKGAACFALSMSMLMAMDNETLAQKTPEWVIVAAGDQLLIGCLGPTPDHDYLTITSQLARFEADPAAEMATLRKERGLRRMAPHEKVIADRNLVRLASTSSLGGSFGSKGDVEPFAEIRRASSVRSPPSLLKKSSSFSPSSINAGPSPHLLWKKRFSGGDPGGNESASPLQSPPGQSVGSPAAKRAAPEATAHPRLNTVVWPEARGETNPWGGWYTALEHALPFLSQFLALETETKMGQVAASASMHHVQLKAAAHALVIRELRKQVLQETFGFPPNFAGWLTGAPLSPMPAAEASQAAAAGSVLNRVSSCESWSKRSLAPSLSGDSDHLGRSSESDSLSLSPARQRTTPAAPDAGRLGMQGAIPASLTPRAQTPRANTLLAGETVYCTKERHETFDNGDHIEHGLRGRVVDPSFKDAHGTWILVEFEGNSAMVAATPDVLSRKAPLSSPSTARVESLRSTALRGGLAMLNPGRCVSPAISLSSHH